MISCANTPKNKNEAILEINESTFLQIGGIEQYIQIKGSNSNNPIILWLHGGPGFPLTYLSYYYQSGLIDKYTIVSLEQRGCGRTYYRNRANDCSIQRLLVDIDELTDYLRKRFNKEKIIILGQSWGTILGITYVQKYPEKVAAYIGVGQVVNFDEGKIYAAETAAVVAREHQNYKDVNELATCMQSFKTSKTVTDLNLANLERMILKSLQYLPAEKSISARKQLQLGLLSPDLNLNDLRWFLIASNTHRIFSHQSELLQYMYFDFDVDTLIDEFKIPIYFIQGSADWITPTDMVTQYAGSISAPEIKTIILNGMGHTPFLDDPEQFGEALESCLSRIPVPADSNAIQGD
ncbi:MAG: alpha/beta hydrolase [Spirochaetes bacterium]|nr:alpha/beta hydrolase [Spirochaetota bacterium]MBU0955151.1 alpha/beta hydrolase [Spirochaetota bacterium]